MTTNSAAFAIALPCAAGKPRATPLAARRLLRPRTRTRAQGRMPARAGASASESRVVVHSLASPESSPSTDEILNDLRRDGEPQQILALISLLRLPSSEAAYQLLKESNVLSSQFRKTRIAALDALGKLRLRSETTGILVDVLRNDSDHSIRAAAAGALSVTHAVTISENFGDNGVTTMYNTELRQRQQQEQKEDGSYHDAVMALRHAATNDEHFIVRYSAIVALGNVCDVEAIPMLLKLVGDRATPTLETASAVDALGEIIAPPDVSPDCLCSVTARATDREDLVRAAVARTLARWRSISDASDALSQMMSNEVRYGRSSFVLNLLQHLVPTSDNTQK